MQWRAGSREAAAREAYPPEGEILSVDGRAVHAVQMGSGPDLVLIHGASANTRDFTFTLAPLLADRYRVTVFDRPGLGWSERLPEGSEGILEQAQHLKAAADALGVETPIVLGQSYGGAVALAWALEHPQDTAAVVNLSGPSHPWDTGVPTLYRINSSTLGSALFVPLLTAFVPQSYVQSAIESIFEPQAVPEGYVDYIGAPLSTTRTALRANAIHRATLKAQIIELVPRYADFPVPMEIVHGDADDIVFIDVHAERMIEDTDQANLTRLPGIGHTPQHVAVDDVIAAIDRAAARAAAE